MKRVGGHMLADAKVEAVVACAQTTFGMRQTDEEVRMVQAIAAECRRHQVASAKARKHVERLSMSYEPSRNMAEVVGKTTSAVLTASIGDARAYKSASAYEKSFGLNLKEKSSGRRQGALRITKRGPGIARKYLYLAVGRLLQRDAVIRAWYAKTVKRDAGRTLEGARRDHANPRSSAVARGPRRAVRCHQALRREQTQIERNTCDGGCYDRQVDQTSIDPVLTGDLHILSRSAMGTPLRDSRIVPRPPEEATRLNARRS